MATAISCRTESGDDYLFLLEETLDDNECREFLEFQLGEESEYISDWNCTTVFTKL